MHTVTNTHSCCNQGIPRNPLYELLALKVLGVTNS